MAVTLYINKYVTFFNSQVAGNEDMVKSRKNEPRSDPRSADGGARSIVVRDGYSDARSQDRRRRTVTTGRGP